ncbi:HD domain-containing protein [Hypoxylon trugodes]|uniref:HD domain-containing protein n=1 Tax=Hypoxylon trugodes TaxID=326681 RepID=UPI00219B82F2|nr:HD domain-containing protein [Hypoxylon trugodes]KAI1386042.1 HD domain-containing protein [Hypoxylon trugodes]
MSLEFVQICMQIKETRRAGWVRRGIKDGESVADHTFGVLLLILQATKQLPAETRLKALEMAIAHDLPEAIIGDYTSADHVSKERKRTEESLAMDFLQCLAPSPTTETLRARLAEYNEHQTPISRLVHQADKLEPLVQALRYSKMFPEAQDLEDFKAHIKYIEDPTLANIGKASLER